MKNIYISILTTALVILANNVAAQEFDGVGAFPVEQEVEPRTQHKFFPGVKRKEKKSLAMHMVEIPNDNADLLNLNSSLVSSTNTADSKKYFDDIEVTDNNIFQLKF